MNTSKLNAKRRLKLFEYVDYEEITKSISRSWLDMESLKNQFPYSPEYQLKMKALSNSYYGWRKVRGDGNCYYRAVISSFFLKIFFYNQSPIYIEKFIALLKSLPTVFPKIFLLSRNHILTFVETYSRGNKSMTEKIEYFKEVNYKLQDVEFDLHLVRVARMVTYYCFHYSRRDEFEPYLLEGEKEQVLERILGMGNEAEGHELKALPLGLDVIVTQANAFETLVFSTYPFQDKMEGDDQRLKIGIICKSRGHYDILYTICDMEFEEFCIKENSYYVDI